MRDVRVAAVQFESVAGDKEPTSERWWRSPSRRRAGGSSSCVTPECGLTGYWFLRRLSVPQLAALAEPVPDGPLVPRLLDLAVRHRMTIGAGLVEAAGGEVFHNTYVVAMPDGRFARHRKLHAFEHASIHSGSRVHRLRHPARLPGRSPDLLRRQHRRERPHRGASRGRGPARARTRPGGCRTPTRT